MTKEKVGYQFVVVSWCCNAKMKRAPSHYISLLLDVVHVERNMTILPHLVCAGRHGTPVLSHGHMVLHLSMSHVLSMRATRSDTIVLRFSALRTSDIARIAIHCGVAVSRLLVVVINHSTRTWQVVIWRTPSHSCHMWGSTTACCSVRRRLKRLRRSIS